MPSQAPPVAVSAEGTLADVRAEFLDPTVNCCGVHAGAALGQEGFASGKHETGRAGSNVIKSSWTGARPRFRPQIDLWLPYPQGKPCREIFGAHHTALFLKKIFRHRADPRARKPKPDCLGIAPDARLLPDAECQRQQAHVSGVSHCTVSVSETEGMSCVNHAT